MAAPAVDIRHVHKQFPSPWGKQGVYAVKGVSLQIPQGSVYGLVGPNGSGKSTIMKMLIGLLAPSSGECEVFGRSATDASNREQIGFLPENPYFYKFLTGEETVRFYGKLCGLRGRALKERTHELLELVGLQDAAKRRLGGYSKGMLQRIGMAQALVQKPKLIVLDEPTAGVDPIGSRVIRDIVMALKGQGMTVFLCSHLLEQVQEVCDRVGILYQGLLIAEGSMDDLTRDAKREEILLENASSDLLERLRRVVDEDGEARWLGSGHPRNSLEDVFLAGIRSQMEKDREDQARKAESGK